MKKFIVILILSYLSSSLFAMDIQKILGVKSNEITYAMDPVEFFYFNENQELEIYSEDSLRKEINELHGTYLYDFKREGKFIYLEIKNEKVKEKFLVLVNEDFIFLFKKGSKKVFWEGHRSIYKNNIDGLYFFYEEEWIKNKELKASSELKENEKKYAVNNLGTLECGKPWIEGVTGNGKGEYIKYRIKGGKIFIFSGYVDVDKPELYIQNSRPKKLLIETDDKKFYVELKDTPNPQEIIIYEKIDREKEYNIKITIDEVYPGTKYQDTCINAMAGDFLFGTDKLLY